MNSSRAAPGPRARASGAWRRASAGLVAGAALMLAAPAGAAPTCVDNAGATVRCDAPGALPVGVAAASQVDPEHDDGVPLPAPAMLFGLFCVVGGLFALIGLMPDFDGWSPEDWERRRKGD